METVNVLASMANWPPSLVTVYDVWWLVSMRVHNYAVSCIFLCRNLCRSCSHCCASLGEKEEPESEPEESEYEQSGVFVSRRFTTLAKLSVDVSDVVSHKLSRNGLS